MKTGNKISESQEDYLEAIFHISCDKQAARAKDIAKRLKVNSSSVTGALRVLSDKGLVNYAPYDLITLTPEGKRKAEEIVRRHEVLRDFFVRILGIESAEAEEGACKVEHAVSPAILESLVQFVEFLDICPRAGVSWMKAFQDYCSGKAIRRNCIDCTLESLEKLRKKTKKQEEENGTRLTLAQLLPGIKARIVGIEGPKDGQDRILEAGIKPGLLVEIKHIDPDSLMLEIKLRGYNIPFTVHDARMVLVDTIEDT